jgi:hypothetical protein
MSFVLLLIPLSQCPTKSASLRTEFLLLMFLKVRFGRFYMLCHLSLLSTTDVYSSLCLVFGESDVCWGYVRVTPLSFTMCLPCVSPGLYLSLASSTSLSLASLP